MKSGIFIVAVGKEYERTAAHTSLYTRRFTDLPIAVVTDVEDKYQLWEHIPNVEFIQTKENRITNRLVKLSMNTLSPFDKTLYIDCDAVVQNKGVEKFIELLDNKDLVLNFLLTMTQEKVLNVYKKCMKMFGILPPIRVHNGGFIAFNKSPEVNKFFETWLEVWKKYGHGREMPALNCAVVKSGIDFGVFPGGFIAPESEKESAIIQHSFNRFKEKFNIPDWKPNKGFQKNDVTDFKWSHYDEP